MLVVILLIVAVVVIVLLDKTLSRSYRRKSIKVKHVVVTGGSSGIGKCVAKLAVHQGAHVTIIGRNHEKLNMVIEELHKQSDMVGQKVQGVSLDVSDFESVKTVFNNLERTIGPIYMLVNCAGLAICGILERMQHGDIKTLINTNLLGTVYPTKAVVENMKQRRSGIIVITASQAALIGIYGLSIYSATKFALRGFAEALDMEVSSYNISVTLALPPDTDTPGFKLENRTKPVVTASLCKSAGIYKPEQVARKLLDDALVGSFFSTLGAESYCLSVVCAGMARCATFADVVMEAFLMGPLRIIGTICLEYFHYVIERSVWKNN